MSIPPPNLTNSSYSSYCTQSNFPFMAKVKLMISDIGHQRQPKMITAKLELSIPPHIVRSFSTCQFDPLLVNCLLVCFDLNGDIALFNLKAIAHNPQRDFHTLYPREENYLI